MPIALKILLGLILIVGGWFIFRAIHRSPETTKAMDVTPQDNNKG